MENSRAAPSTKKAGRNLYRPNLLPGQLSTIFCTILIGERKFSEKICWRKLKAPRYTNFYTKLSKDFDEVAVAIFKAIRDYLFEFVLISTYNEIFRNRFFANLTFHSIIASKYDKKWWEPNIEEINRQNCSSK